MGQESWQNAGALDVVVLNGVVTLPMEERFPSDEMKATVLKLSAELELSDVESAEEPAPNLGASPPPQTQGNVQAPPPPTEPVMGVIPQGYANAFLMNMLTTARNFMLLQKYFSEYAQSTAETMGGLNGDGTSTGEFGFYGNLMDKLQKSAHEQAKAVMDQAWASFGEAGAGLAAATIGGLAWARSGASKAQKTYNDCDTFKGELNNPTGRHVTAQAPLAADSPIKAKVDAVKGDNAKLKEFISEYSANPKEPTNEAVMKNLKSDPAARKKINKATGEISKDAQMEIQESHNGFTQTMNWANILQTVLGGIAKGAAGIFQSEAQESGQKQAGIAELLKDAVHQAGQTQATTQQTAAGYASKATDIAAQLANAKA